MNNNTDSEFTWPMAACVIAVVIGIVIVPVFG